MVNQYYGRYLPNDCKYFHSVCKSSDIVSLAYKCILCITEFALKMSDFLLFFRSVITGIDDGNITVIIYELGFVADKGTDINLKFFAHSICVRSGCSPVIVDSIKFELLGVMSFFAVT